MHRLVLLVASGLVLLVGCAGTQANQSTKPPLLLAENGGTVPLPKSGDKLVCERVTVTGSRVTQKVCRLQSLREEDERGAEELMRSSVQTRGHIGQ